MTRHPSLPSCPPRTGHAPAPPRQARHLPGPHPRPRGEPRPHRFPSRCRSRPRRPHHRGRPPRAPRWGGSLESRARFPRQVVAAVRDAVGGRLAVTAKLNMTDGVPGGLWVDESIEVARMLEAGGALDAIELTGGSSLQNPMYLFRGEAPIREMAATMPGAIGLGFRLLGKRFLPEYPFEEAYFLPYARQFREALTMPLILLGGINRIDTVQRAMAEGFEFVAMGRALLREPDLVAKLQTGVSSEGLCIHCNKCMPTIYRGTHCVLVE